MRPLRLLAIVLTLAWALWFGGLITLFLAVTSLFTTFDTDRSLAGTAAAGIFRRFESYQLVLAAVALVTAATWRASRPPRPRSNTVVLVFLALAAVVAVSSTFAVSRRIEKLRRQSLTATPEFRRLHGVSMGLYTGEAALLLAAGLALPSAVSSSCN